VGQNIKYDTHVLANHGITVRATRTTPCCRAMCWKPTAAQPGEPGRAPPGPQGLSYEDLCGKGANQIPFSQVDIERATTYSGEDSEMTLQVHQTLWPQLQAEPGLRASSTSASRCRCREVLAAHRAPRRADRRPGAGAAEPASWPSAWWRWSSEAYEMAGQPFNLGSPKQIGEILFGPSWACR
jgi:DNA polymerase-1